MAKPKLSAVASKGDRRKTLETMRDVLAAQIDSCNSGRDVAALTLRFLDVERELASLPDPKAKQSAVAKARQRAAEGKKDG